MPRSNDFCESTQPEDSCQASQSARERKRGRRRWRLAKNQNWIRPESSDSTRSPFRYIHPLRERLRRTDRHANSAISRAKICPKIRWAIFRNASIRDVRYNLNFQSFDPLRVSAFGPDLAFVPILSLSAIIIYAWSPRIGLMEWERETGDVLVWQLRNSNRFGMPVACCYSRLPTLLHQIATLDASCMTMARNGRRYL